MELYEGFEVVSRIKGYIPAHDRALLVTCVEATIGGLVRKFAQETLKIERYTEPKRASAICDFLQLGLVGISARAELLNP